MPFKISAAHKFVKTILSPAPAPKQDEKKEDETTETNIDDINEDDEIIYEEDEDDEVKVKVDPKKKYNTIDLRAKEPAKEPAKGKEPVKELVKERPSVVKQRVLANNARSKTIGALRIHQSSNNVSDMY